MQTIYSKQHKEIVGSVNDAPYTVSFDADGFAEVEEAVAAQLTSGNFGVTLIDEDGAEVDAEKAEAERIAKEAEEARLAEAEKLAAEEAAKAKKESKKQKTEGDPE